jgi:hypothetical protein
VAAIEARRPFAERLAADPALADRLTPGEIAALLAPEAYTGLAATSAREVAGGPPPAAGNRP